MDGRRNVALDGERQSILDENMSVSTALPRLTSIHEEGGRTILATLKPTTLLVMDAEKAAGTSEHIGTTYYFYSFSGEVECSPRETNTGAVYASDKRR